MKPTPTKLIPAVSCDELHPLTKYDLLGLTILKEIYESPAGVRRSSLQASAHCTYAKAKKRLDWLSNDGFLRIDRMPHVNAHMPPTYIYFKTEKTTVEEIDAVYQVAKSNELTKFESGASLKDVLGQIRPSAAKAYIQILCALVELGEPTVAELVESGEGPPQTYNSQLRRLMDLRLVERKKSYSVLGRREYRYFLAKGVSKDEVIKIAASYGLRGQPSTSEQISQEVGSNKETCSPKVTRDQILLSFPDFPATAYKEVQLRWFDVYELLLKGAAPQDPPGGLPPFNPSWSQEMQADWMAIYRALLKADSEVNEFRCEQIMQIVNGQ